METKPICPSCQKTLPPGVPLGLCPECLIKSGFNTGTEPGKAGKDSGFVPPPVEELRQLFPQLEIIELIGKGGMGAVYKARQPTLDRFVALKILPPGAADDAGFAERFNREARALARLSHPHIVAVHDFGQLGGQPYLVMEFVDGPNLRQVEQTGRLTPAQALEIIPQICEALQFAHNEGVVHRDIKPENILLDKKGRVKITDFGIAKIVGVPSGRASLTGVKDVLGTPHYMAPEQVEHPQTVDHRADIYSLGVVFYEMLTGELPLGKFQSPSKKVQMDVRLDEVVLHALAKEPERRYQHVSEVKTDVETIAATPGQSSSRREEASSAGEHGRLPLAATRYNPWELAITVGGTTLLLALLFFATPNLHRPVNLLLIVICIIGLVICALTFAGLWPVTSRLFPKPNFSSRNLPGRKVTGSSQVTEPPSVNESDLAKVREEVKAPAIALFIVGCLNLGVALPVLTYSYFTAGVTHGRVGGGELMLLLLAGYALTLIGASAMRRLGSYGLAIAGTICAMILPLGLIIGLPLGIWSLIVLNRREVREAFGKAHLLPPETAQPKRSGGAWKVVVAVMIALAIPVVALLLAIVIPAWSRASQPRYVLTGTVTEAATGKPISGAHVTDNRYGSTATKAPRDAWTDANGHYTLRTWPEEHTVAVYAPGFENGTATLTTSLWGRESTARIDFQLERATNNSKFTFGPVIERVISDPGKELKDCFLDFDTGRVLSASREFTNSSSFAGTGLGANWARTNGVDLMKQEGGNFVFLEGFTIMSTIPFEAQKADEVVRYADHTSETMASHVEPGFIMFCDLPPAVPIARCWLFRTREGGCGVLGFVGNTKNPRGVKIRYKLVQPAAGGSAASKPKATADQVIVEDLALQMLAAIRDKDDTTLKSLATDSVQPGWRDALPRFAGEMRERFVHLTDKPFTMYPAESLVEGARAVVKCTGPKELGGTYLVLFFVKTADGWRNWSLRNSPPSTPLTEHLKQKLPGDQTPGK